MDQPPSLQPRTRFLLTLLGLLLLCALPMFIVYSLVRAIRVFIRRLTGQGDEATPAAVAQAQKRARKAKAAYNAANKQLQRASAQLAKAQARLEALQKPDQERPAALPALPKIAAKLAGASSPAQFWLGIGKWLANYLIERQMKKLP